jgi:hypothetical protein
MKHEKEQPGAVTRRSFLRKGAAAISGITAVSAAGFETSGEQTTLDANASTVDRTGGRSPAPSSFLDLLRVPEGVTVYRGFEKTLPVGLI